MLAQTHRKGRKFEWTNECQSAFEGLKNRLVSSPILAHPDFSKTFILDTDASNEAIGAVLSQEIDGKERPIAFVSRTLTKPERRYCITRKELLAIVFFVKHFKHYLYGKQFIVRTDHGSLRWLLNFKNPEGQLARCLQVLSSYEMTIVHRPGRQHRNADALSHMPCTQCGFDPNWENTENLAQHVRNIQERKTQEVDEKGVSISEKQQSDKDLTLIRKWVEKGEQPELKEITGESITVKSVWAQFDQLTIIDDVLVRQLEGLKTRLQVLVPMTERRTILSHYHDNRTSAHIGLRKTLAKIRQGYYWPGLQKGVKLYVAGCSFCSQTKPPNKMKRAPMQIVETGFPMERIAMDILCELPETSGGNKHILVISDYYTKWTECFTMPNMETKTVAKLLVRFGTPYVIHTDQGVQFESNLFQEVCRLLQIQKTQTTPYPPQSYGWSSGITERYLRCCPHLSMTIKAIRMNTSVTFQWLIEPQSMKQRETLRII